MECDLCAPMDETRLREDDLRIRSIRRTYLERGGQKNIKHVLDIRGGSDIGAFELVCCL
jgi:hypothetical protein